MKLRAAVGLTALGLWAGPLVPPAAAQQPPAPADAAPIPPAQLFARARAEIDAGRFDVAGETLKKFLAGNPTDADYLKVTENEPTAFLKLRNVPVWSDEPTANAEYKAVAERVIAGSEAANKKFLRDPARVTKFVRNLGETPEERIYAEQQLRLSGDAVVPVLVDTLRTTSDPTLLTGAAGAVGKLNADQLPGILAASVGLTPEVRLNVLRAAVARPDAQALSASPDTDLAPHLWYLSSARAAELNALREFASLTLNGWTAGEFPRKQAAAELVALSRPLAARQGNFRGADKVKVWRFDPATQTVAGTETSAADANDYFALRNLRWAVERAPGNAPATELFLTVAVERGVERSQFGSVLNADPELLPVLAAAPSTTLVNMLDRALTENKTALALGLIQVLSARSDKLAAGVGSERPSPLVRALDFPDSRVQLAAAVGLLKVPGAVPRDRAARVVDILRRALSVEPGGPNEVGRAVIADPDDVRAERLARYLRTLGYSAERYGSGRDLARRVQSSAGADLIFIDRHVVAPELRDLLTAIRQDVNSSRRPVFVVASDTRAALPPLDNLLLRLAYLVAVTETADIRPPAPFSVDPRRPVKADDEPRVRAEIIARRDKLLGELYVLRLGRLRRLVSGGDLPQSPALQALLDLRLPQLTYAALAAEYPVSATNAPETYRQLVAKTNALTANPRLVASTRGVIADGLSRIVEDLDGALDPARRDMLEGMLARTDTATLAVPEERPADPTLGDRLDRLARSIGGVTVINEPNSPIALQNEIQKGTKSPAQLPVPAAVKRQNALVALDYLRRMAVGEVTGFDVRPAEVALRTALKDDEFTLDAADAVARFGSADAQADLVNVAIGVGRPLPLKVRAADRAIQHAQTFGRLLTAPQQKALADAAVAEKDADLKARLTVLDQLLATRPADLSGLITRYPLPAPPAAPAAAPAPAPADKKEPGPKKEPEKN